MKNRQKTGIGCMGVAAALAVSAIKRLFESQGIAVTDPSGLGVSRLVGSFLPAIILAAVGVWLFQNPKEDPS